MLENIVSFLKELVGQGKPFQTSYMTIPGIGTGSAYASGEAFGTIFELQVPKRGIIDMAIMLDLDDEGIQTELWLFSEKFTPTADNNAFAVTDNDLMNLQVIISVSAFANANVNQVGINNGLHIPYFAPKGILYCQCVTRGVPNIAAGHLPLVRLSGYER